MEDEIDNHRFRDEIFARTQAAIREHDAESLLRLMDEQGIWTTLVYGYEELVNDPQVKHNGSFIEYDHPTEGRVLTPGFPIRFSLTPSRVNRGAPLPGEHTTEILSKLGLSDEEIEDLREQAIVAETRI